uniref:LIM zinc-binding domain-containing protein n=1 Tax=Megaselia scalaris TaxID=36166 RepID=T1GVD5_MEGSC
MEVVEENCTTVVTVEKIEKKKTKKSKSSKNSMKKSFSKFDALQKKPENEQPEQKICQVCEKPVYKMEEILIKKKISFHRNCFKCVECRKPLSADFFQSEDGTLYCSIHWKKKFEKRIDDEEKENGTTPLRKTELIIRESNPVPLPPDVVRSSEKSSLGLEDLEKRNNRNIRSRFENGWNEKMAKMEDDEEDDSEFENDENEDNENRRQPKFSQMSEFRRSSNMELKRI